MAEVGLTTPIHVVEYYRYLRFDRFGNVLAYQSTSVPRDTVKLIKWSNRELQVGKYQINESGRLVLNLIDPKQPLNRFEQTIQLKSTKPGKNNRLVWIHYVMWTPNQSNDMEEIELDLATYRAYQFHRVKSFI